MTTFYALLALIALLGLTYWLAPWIVAQYMNKAVNIPLTPEQLLEIRKANTIRRLEKSHPGARFIDPKVHADDVAVRRTAKKLGISRRAVRKVVGLA